MKGCIGLGRGEESFLNTHREKICVFTEMLEGFGGNLVPFFLSDLSHTSFIFIFLGFFQRGKER